jgi:hypothetical protein
MKCPSDNLLADKEAWTAILEPVLCQDAAAVECLARLLFTIKTAIDSGPEGAIQASNTLLNGIELISPHQRPQSCAQSVCALVRGQIEAAGRAS